MKSLHSETNFFLACTATGLPAPLPIVYLPHNVNNVANISRPTRKASGTFSTTNLRSLMSHIYPSDLRHITASMPVNSRPIRPPAMFSEKFIKLDSWSRAGLHESEFKKLFAKCICGLVMTTRVFQDHDCVVTVVPHTIIDLTTDDDNDSVVIDLTNDS